MEMRELDSYLIPTILLDSDDFDPVGWELSAYMYVHTVVSAEMRTGNRSSDKSLPLGDLRWGVLV